MGTTIWSHWFRNPVMYYETVHAVNQVMIKVNYTMLNVWRCSENMIETSRRLSSEFGHVYAIIIFDYCYKLTG